EQDPVASSPQKEIEHNLTADIRIVGIVQDTRHSPWNERWAEEVYLPYTQVGPEDLGQIKLFIRTPGDPKTIIPAVRGEVQSIDGDLPLVGMQTQAEEMDQLAAGGERSLGSLLCLFSALAVVMAGPGPFGTMCLSVQRKSKESGDRVGTRR